MKTLLLALFLSACTTPAGPQPVEPAGDGSAPAPTAPAEGAPWWVKEIGEVAITIGLGYLGLRRLPNRFILGTEHDPEVAKVAGVR